MEEKNTKPAVEAPVQQTQYFAADQKDNNPVQYVVMADSLKGVKGWLLFFVIVFGLSGIGYISMFFGAMNDLSVASNILNLIFTPILAALAITTVVFIAQEKKLGKLLSVATLGAMALYTILTTIVSAASGEEYMNVAGVISSIVVTLVMTGLVGLYFFVSKRVKETLAK